MNRHATSDVAADIDQHLIRSSEIVERYESLIEGVRETVHQISARMKPLTDEIDMVSAPEPDHAQAGQSPPG